MSERILTNAQIVLANNTILGTVVIRDGVIAEVSEGRSVLSNAQDLEGDLLIPGLVELHTDNLERHVMPRPETYWPTDSAVMAHDREIASVGITTVLNAICIGEVHPKAMRLEMLDDMFEAIAQQKSAGALKADHYLHLRCEVSYSGLKGLLEGLIDHPLNLMVSSMDHTPGQRQFVRVETYAEYYQGKFGLSDQELKDFMDERRADQKAYSLKNRKLVAQMCADRGIALASHDDATKAHVDEAIEEGMVIAEFPTTIEAADASREAGLAVLMGGPNLVRGKSHSGNVSARDLAARGALDIISSDYIPSSQLYGALLLEREFEEISLSEAIATVTKTPAEKIGLNDRGVIEAGRRADLVRVHRGEGAPVVRDVWVEGVKIA